MTTTQRHRLLNAAQTVVDCPAGLFTHRHDCVEITASDDTTMLVMYRLFEHNAPAEPEDPTLFGSIVLPGNPTILQPHMMDEHKWLLQVDETIVTISPYEGCEIYPDPSFEHMGCTSDRNRKRRDMLRDRRSIIFGIMANQRLLVNIPRETEAARVHDLSIQILTRRLHEINRKLGIFLGCSAREEV
jgi:hypothetical protein